MSAEMPSEGEFEAVPGLLALPFKMNSSEIKQQILQRGRPKPVVAIAKKDARSSESGFESSWYVTHKWLCGSAQLKKFFCWPCLLMRPESSSWCATGVDDLKRFSALATKHSSGKTHIKAIAEYDGTLLESGLAPEFVNETSAECKVENDSDSETDYVSRYSSSKRAKTSNTEKSDTGSSERQTLTFRSWQQAGRATIEQVDPKLARRRRRLALIDIKNAELTSEKLRLEIQLLKAKLELQRAINVSTLESLKGEKSIGK